MWIIKGGVQASEQVIVEGFQKVREGSPVVPKPYQASKEGK
jgi:membrane fusion protein (multidrug efflux system)